MLCYYICWEEDNQMHCKKERTYHNALQVFKELVDRHIDPDDICIFSKCAAIKP